MISKWNSEERDANGWPRHFIEDTCGSLANDLIKQSSQEPMSAALAAELAQWQALAMQTLQMFPYTEGNQE